MVEKTFNLTGVWHGLYSYDQANAPVYFVATLLCGQNWISGTSHEAVNEIANQPLTMFANLEGTVSDTLVAFVKSYDGSNGWAHQVPYSGSISPDASEIEGTWEINQTGYLTTSGRFLMIRSGMANEAVVRAVYERA
jgi:hypothetical protein